MSEGLVKSAARVMSIFECFEDSRRPMTISELVNALSVPQSSMSALMKSLLLQGFVDYDQRRRTYTPSVRVALLGNWVLGSSEQLENLHALMQQIYDATGDTVLLGVQNGIAAQYIHVINSEKELRYHLRPGMYRPMFRSGIGLLLASLKDDKEIGLMIRRVNLEAESARDYVVESEVMARLAEIRRDGYVVTASLATKGAGVVGTLLKRAPSPRPICIAIGAPDHRIHSSRDLLLETLLSAVERYDQTTAPGDPGAAP